MEIEDKVYQVRFNSDALPHIRVDVKACQACDGKPCLYVWPVQNFTLQDDGRVDFAWERCMECGACRLVCRAYGKSAVDWSYPRGGFGVSFRYG